MTSVTEFGQRWDERVPRDAIKRLLSRTHVSATDADVETDVIMRIEKGRDAAKYTESLRRQTVRYALEVHRRNRALYLNVMQGNLK
jgi:hypothetical protein